MDLRFCSPLNSSGPASRRKRAISRPALTRESSGSSPSDASSIYNAARASSGLEDLVPRAGSTLNGGMAANMAMFVASPSKHTISNPPKPNASESHILSLKDDGQRVNEFVPEGLPEVSRFGQRGHRETASGNDAADTSMRASRWLGSVLSPASPILPTYPQPVRVPTPPGLPSFGTVEAVRSTAQFPAHSAPYNGQSQQYSCDGNSADGNRIESYGEWLRRFFGISSSSAIQPRRQACVAVGPGDGTVVQGCFPNRHSAHGVGASGRLDDHPFHRRNLSVAQCDGIDKGGAAVRAGPSDMEHRSGIKQQSSVHSGDHEPAFRSQFLSNSISPGPSYLMALQSATTFASPADRRALEQGARRTLIGDMPTVLASEPSSGCSLTQTRSMTEPSIHEGCVMLEHQHRTSKIVNSYLRCCSKARNEQDTIISVNTASNDTYATAQSRVLDDSAANSQGKQGTAHDLGCYCSNMWTSFRAFITSRNYGSSSWLEQTQEPF